MKPQRWQLVATLLLSFGLAPSLRAQKGLPIIRATRQDAVMEDGKHVKLAWRLDPHAKPDTYYVNVPRKKSRITLRTDQGSIRFTTTYGQRYDGVVLLNGQDSCFVRILAQQPPSPVSRHVSKSLPDTIPFTLIGSRLYFQGHLNDQPVTIQLDLGAGGACVNKLSSAKLQLAFAGKTVLSNTQGVHDARLSSGNRLQLGDYAWSGVPLTEVGNMGAHEDLIIGNGLFRDKIIEIDYDQHLFIVHDRLPTYAKHYHKQPVYYEQDRPKFKASFVQNGKKHAFWFLFDTGRDGTMLLGEDFTGQQDNWLKLQELQVLNGRKIVRLDALIAGTRFKDIVTNAADPAKPAGRSTLFGNAVLNHFNVILDNQQGYLYLKSNGRSHEPYADYQQYLKDIQRYRRETAK